MPAVGDVVQLQDGSVGVISDQLSSHGEQQWRVAFPESRLDIIGSDIADTLDAPVYSPGDNVFVWPNSGTIQSVGDDSAVVTIERSETLPGLGMATWQSDDAVPLWRLTLDNDGRLQRIW